MREFAIGDIHGDILGLKQCLLACGFNYEKDMLIQLGDVVDGDDKVYECVEELLKIKYLIPIRGNHDDLFLQFLRTGHHPAFWKFGGPATIRSYSIKAGKQPKVISSSSGFKTSLNPDDVPASHRKFFEEQVPFYIDTNNNCFVHAGFNPYIPFSEQRPETLFWDRDLWQRALDWQVNEKYGTNYDSFSMVPQFNCIFLGHTSTMHWRIDKPMKAANIYNLDTGGSKGGRLTIMEVDTKQFWQSDTRQTSAIEI